MDLFPPPTGMVVLLGIALIASVVAHWRIRRFWPASLLSALATTAAFAVASYLQAGVPTSLEPRPMAYFTGFGLLVAVVVGLLARAVRRPAQGRA